MTEAPVPGSSPGQALPSWRYHVSGHARIITTVEELQALEAGQWFESPQEAADAARAGEAESETPSPRSRR